MMDRPSSDETSPLLGQFASNSVPTSPFPVILPDKGKYAKYKRRWYIWLLFVLVSNISSLLEYTWSPIQETCQLVYGWTNQNTLVIGVLESLTSFVTILPWAWVLDNKGLRLTVISAVIIQSLAAIVVIFPCDNRCKTLLVYLNSSFLGLANTVTQSSAILVLVAAWFPPTERTAVTVYTFLLSDLGLAVSNIIGPYVVPDVTSYHFGHKVDINVLRNETTPERMEYLREQISRFLCIEAGIMVFLLVCLYIYFPDKPPKPPSASSTTCRLEFLQGVKKLLTNKQFLLLVATFSLSNGVQWGWIIVMDVILAGVGINQKTVGWIGFGMKMFIFPTVFASSLSYHFRHYIKHTLAILFVSASCLQSIFSLACNKIIPLSKGILFATAFLHNMFFCANEPLLYDLAADCAFPVAEGLVSGVILTCTCFTELIFYVIFMFLVNKSNNPLWMNWVLAAAEIVCAGIILCYRGKRKRLDVDVITKPDKCKTKMFCFFQS